MVITRRTRNPLAFRGPWVRIPPAPPSKKLFAFFGKELFAWKDLPSDASPHTPRRHASSAPAGDILRQSHLIRLFHRIAASADDRVLRSRKSSQPSPFQQGS